MRARLEALRRAAGRALPPLLAAASLSAALVVNPVTPAKADPGYGTCMYRPNGLAATPSPTQPLLGNCDANGNFIYAPAATPSPTGSSTPSSTIIINPTNQPANVHSVDPTPVPAPTAADGNPLADVKPAPSASPFFTLLTPSSSANLSSVASSTSSVSILATNANRKCFVDFNASTAIQYLAFSSTASTNAYTIQIPPNSTYELGTGRYVGPISAVWGAVSGTAQITECQ